jgi:hypothetical protein
MPTFETLPGVSQTVGEEPHSSRTNNLAGLPAALVSFPAVCVALIAASVLAICAGRMAEPDIWWHLRNAQYLLSNSALPRVDIYSFGAAGSAWLNHEWLSEVPFFLGFRAFGLRGMLAVYSVVIVLIFAGVFYRTARASGNYKDAVLLTLVGVMLGVVSFGPRMLLFGWLCMVVELVVLDHFRDTGKGLWILPLLFLAWINFHGSWVYGIVVLLITIAGGLVDGEWGNVVASRWSRMELTKLVVASGLSCAALFANPFGYRLVLYPFDLLFRQQSNLKHMQEWQSVDFSVSNGKLAMAVLLALLAIAWFSRKKWRLDEVLLTAFALWGALSHWRLLFFAGLVLPTIVARHVDLLPSDENERHRPLLNAAIIVAILAGCIYFYPSEESLQEDVSSTYPTTAIRFLEQAHIAGPVFNLYGWGGYLEWYARDVKPFIDGRADIFVYNGTFDDYGRITYMEAPLETLDKYRIDYVLFRPETPFAYLLDHHPEWKIIYSDPVAKLYRRKTPLFNDITAQLRTPSASSIEHLKP